MRQRICNPRSNLPPQNLKWSLGCASAEFKLAPNSLRKYLHQIDAEPDADGCYSTAQICDAIFGDLRAERLRKERQLTKKYELENAITEASVLNRSELMKGLAGIADAMVSRIMSSALSREAKEDLLRDLAGIPIVIDNVAARQTRLRRSKNGQAVEDDEGES